MIRILRGDVLRFAAHYRGLRFHALLCDAPYEMGFMGKDWDGSGVSFQAETWAALSEHLLPGAFLFVMAGTINDDLISVAMRGAGLRKFHKAMAWVYGQGFPKATRISANGKSEAWAGHRYGLQALKPAAESILIFQKPYDGRPVDSITEHGAGALWVDGGRIGINGETPTGSGRRDSWRELEGRHDRQKWNGGNVTPEGGRWPANFALSHAPGCEQVGTRRVKGNGAFPQRHGSSVFVQPEERPERIEMSDPDGLETVAAWRCADGCPVAALGEQSGERTSGLLAPHHNAKPSTGWSGGSHEGRIKGTYGGDTGTAARFFFQADWHYEIAERIAAAAPVRYTAKASRRERDAGLEGMPEYKVVRYQEMKTQGPLPKNTPRRIEMQRNSHPTVKPIALARWLATLLLPPAEYAPRRLLVPFAGVGSEMIGAMQAGWDEVIGVEREREYIPITRARIQYWTGWRQ